MTWTVKGEAVIMDGDRPVAVVDRTEDAELIVKAVDEHNKFREMFNIFANSSSMKIMAGDMEIKIGGLE